MERTVQQRVKAKPQDQDLLTADSHIFLDTKSLLHSLTYTQMQTHLEIHYVQK